MDAVLKATPHLLTLLHVLARCFLQSFSFFLFLTTRRPLRVGSSLALGNAKFAVIDWARLFGRWSMNSDVLLSVARLVCLPFTFGVADWCWAQ